MSDSSSSIGSAELDSTHNEVALDSEPVFLKPSGEEDEKKTEEERAEQKKIAKVRKVSPVKKFFSSIRVVFIIVLLCFTCFSAGWLGWVSITNVRGLYEAFDQLDVKERIQQALHGTTASVVALLTRAMMTTTISEANLANFWPDGKVDTSDPNFEGYLAYMMIMLKSMTEGPGAYDYDYIPYQLIMAWDENWNEKMVYYRTCTDPSNKSYCTLPPPEDAFVNFSGFPFDLRLKYKDKVPKIFRDIPKYMNSSEKTEICDPYLRCAGLVDIGDSEGGSMFFNLLNLGNASNRGFEGPFNNWHFLIGFNAKIMPYIQANRTGLCVSVVSQSENKTGMIPSKDREEFNFKQKNKDLILSPVNATVNQTNYVVTLHDDTGRLSLKQVYYTRTGDYNAVVSDRQVCDPFYEHDKEFVSQSSVYLTYSTFNFNTLQQDDTDTVMLRFDYHNPRAKGAHRNVTIVVAVLIPIWFIAIFCTFLYFDHQFLSPLDQMRKLREDLIKTAIAGLDDDENKARELFGDLVDDEALIKANGDEITVMRTLQERVDLLYTDAINTRTAELSHMRSVARSEMHALRVMNLFMRRDDESLRIVLPGLMEPFEMNRRVHAAAAIVVRGQKTDPWIEDLASAKHAFRSLKAVLGNPIAAQYFQAFCTQRGRSSVNSLFFIMDVSWLHQAESGCRGDDDFLSAMFSDSVSSTPATARTPGVLKSNEPGVVGLSTDLLAAANDSNPDLLLPEHEPSRPHHSHFAKSHSAAGGSAGSRSSVSSDSIPKKIDFPSANSSADNSAANSRVKVPKLPVAGIRPAQSEIPSPGRSNVPQFVSKIGESIARFIHESYFGKKSLAQHDMRHAALLGCSQIPDYLNLRDKDKIVYSPVMFDNLVTAVTKKFTTEVIPQFLNSLPFQVMVRSLLITGYFKKGEKAQEHKEEQVDENGKPIPAFKRDSILRWMWLIGKGIGKKANKKDEDEDDESSSSDDGDDDDDNDNDDNSKKKQDDDDEKSKESKKEEKPSDKPSKDEVSSDTSSSSSSSSDDDDDDD